MSAPTIERVTLADSATRQRDAARRSRRRALDERLLLLSVLTRFMPAHLARPARGTQTDEFDSVLCFHSPAGQLSWRVTATEIEELFAHVPKGDPTCAYDGHRYADKLARLQSLAFGDIPVIVSPPKPRRRRPGRS